jgi:hypothetical protein
MSLIRSLLTLLTVSSVSAPALAEDFKLLDVKPGLEGIAVTAGTGNVLQRFDVRVVEIVRDGDLPFVLMRASGKFLDEVGGVGQGFSGSPVYVNNKLLGAISGGFPNGDHRLVLVTPIEVMRRAPVTTTLQANGLNLLESFGAPRVCVTSQGCAAPLATPLSVSGLSSRGLRALRTELEARGWNANVMPLQSTSSASGIRAFKLEPGAPIAAQLASGDVSVGAVGTVTTVDGKGVLAFGHPVFGDSRVRYLMQGAYVLGFVNSSVVPFKLAEPVGNPLGLFVSDRPYGLGGTMGAVAPLPLEINVKRGKDSSSTNINLAPVEDIAGVLGLATTLSALDQTLEGNAPGMVKMTWRLEFSDRATMLEYGDRVADADDIASAAARRAALLLALIAENPYRSANLKKLSLTLEVAPYNALRVIRADLERKSLKAGETTTLNLRLQPYRSASVQRRIALRIPSDAEPGKLKLRVRGASTARPVNSDSPPENPDPWDGLLTFDELLERMRSRITGDYAVVETVGADQKVIGAEAFGDIVTGWVYVDVQVIK